MKAHDLDNNIVNWHLTGNIGRTRSLNKSSLHLDARKILKELYPTMQILEEVPIPLRRSETLYLDFYIPLIKTAIEVHGEQHFKFVPFYHTSPMSFIKAQKKDNDKKEWCERNGIKHIILSYNESIDNWKLKVKFDA